MGQNDRGFKVSLDWALNPINAQKILDGSVYDNRSKQAGYIGRKTSYLDGSFNPSERSESFRLREKKCKEILASIKDPLWKKWCSQLDISPHSKENINLWELEGISKAWFIEVEADRLVWIRSSDQNTLNRIENLRLKLWNIIQRNFPEARTLRTAIDAKS